MNEMKADMAYRSEFVLVDGHRMHIFVTGAESGTTLVFMSGSGTVSPRNSDTGNPTCTKLPAT